MKGTLEPCGPRGPVGLLLPWQSVQLTSRPANDEITVIEPSVTGALIGW